MSRPVRITGCLNAAPGSCSLDAGENQLAKSKKAPGGPSPDSRKRASWFCLRTVDELIWLTQNSRFLSEV